MKRLRHWVWWDPPWKLYQWPPAWPLYFGGDEYGRRTAVLHLPLLGRLVVAVTKHGHFPLEEGQLNGRRRMGDVIQFPSRPPIKRRRKLIEAHPSQLTECWIDGVGGIRYDPPLFVRIHRWWKHRHGWERVVDAESVEKWRDDAYREAYKGDGYIWVKREA